jgi:hypothetical protein
MKLCNLAFEKDFQQFYRSDDGTISRVTQKLLVTLRSTKHSGHAHFEQMMNRGSGPLLITDSNGF